MSEHQFAARHELDRGLADDVADKLTAAINERGRASLVVSGGSTPKGFFALLSERDLPWEKVTILAADDRWVALSDPASNETMIREHLMVGPAAGATLLSLVSAYPDSAKNLSDVTAALSALPTFDVVILGMGLDGHTASLFPCSEQLDVGLTTTAPALMTTPTTAPHRRVSLSRARLADCRAGLVHITGKDKLAVFQRAQATLDTAQAPVAAFLGGENPFKLWYAP